MTFWIVFTILSVAIIPSSLQVLASFSYFCMPCCKNWQKGGSKGSHGPEWSNSKPECNLSLSLVSANKLIKVSPWDSCSLWREAGWREVWRRGTVPSVAWWGRVSRPGRAAEPDPVLRGSSSCTSTRGCRCWETRRKWCDLHQQTCEEN